MLFTACVRCGDGRTERLGLGLRSKRGAEIAVKVTLMKKRFDESLFLSPRASSGEDWLHLLQKVGNVGIFDWNLASDVAIYSEQYKVIHGLLPGTESETFSEWLERVHPEDRARIVPVMRDFNGASREAEYRVIRPLDGQVRWIEERREILRDGEGKPVRVIGLQRDITAERNAIAALAESERRLSIAVQAASIGIWEWDIRSDKMIYSRIAREISGLDPEKPLCLQDIANTVHPEDFPRTSFMLRRALDPLIRESLPYEYRIVLPDGSTRWVLAHGEALFEEGEAGAVATRYLGTIQDISARKRASEIERENLQRLRLALEAGRMAAWELDIVTDSLTKSPELNRVLGFPEDADLSREEIGKGYLEGERQRVQAIAAAAMQAGERFFEAEFKFRPPGGELRWLLLRCEVVSDEHGRPVRAVGVVADATARKQAQEALDETTALLNASIENAPIGFAFMDRENRYARVNARLAEYNKVPVAQHIGLSFDDVAPAFAAILRAEVHKVFETGRPIEGHEVDEVRADGARSWLTSLFPVLDAAGAVRFVGMTCIDITDRKRAEAQVRALNDSLERRVAEALAEKRRLAEVIEHADVLVLVADKDFNWLAINHAASKAFARVFGVPPPRVGDNMMEALKDKPAYQAEVRAIWSRAFAGEEFVETQAFGDPSIDQRYFEIRFRTLRDPDGTSIGAYQFVSDVTERVREQARLVEAEAALRQAQKMDAVGRLSGGIAHDFNNLLQGVSGSFDLIRSKPNDAARVLRWAEAGQRASERGAKLTAQLLAFSRAQNIEVRPHFLSELVAGTRDLIERTLGPAVRVVFQLEDSCPPVLADATQLEMAVLNLAINARDAMPNGGVLTISARQRLIDRQDGELEPGSYAELSVSDNGAGMPPEVQARAFDPFFTTKGVGKGTGLGLSQVYGIARQSGGTTRIESGLGLGTTVRMFLRCTDETPDSAQSAWRSPVVSADAARILVVDDDPDARQFVADALDSFGYAVEAVEDGAAALDALRVSRSDLMVLDFAMPGLNGAEVFDAARREWPDLPVLMISGYAETAAVEKVIDQRVPFLRKPFSLVDLAHAVSESLTQTRRKPAVRDAS